MSQPREAALVIAHELAASAIWSGAECAFQGATPPDSLGQPPRARSMRGDLYEGSAGIARFLGQAAALTGDATLRRTALGALRHSWHSTEDWPLFTGALGPALVTLELAELLDPALYPEGIRLVDQAATQAEDHAQRGTAPYDFLVGMAGVVAGLAWASPLEPRWRERASALGRKLLAAGVPEEMDSADGLALSWPLAPGSPMRLCGLAHGASGVALAFTALDTVAPGGGWAAAARRARAFERMHYSPEHGSWADLREAAGGYPHMWCHGSIGVAAERLGALREDLMARADAVGALSGVRAYVHRLLAGPVGPGGSDALNASLCHGLAGVIDLFIDTWKATGDTGWIASAEEVAGLMCNDARRDGGWRSGVPGGWPAPGLMLGRAGTGWALLRLAEPDRLPSAWRYQFKRNAN